MARLETRPVGIPPFLVFGLFVAYQSTATNLTSMAVPAGVQQVYLYQNCPANSFPGFGQTGGMFPGCTPTTSVASLDSSGKPGDKDSINPSLDLIGLSVAFESLADNIVGNMPGNGFHQVLSPQSVPESANTSYCRRSAALWC
jgi:hypothetical protein